MEASLLWSVVMLEASEMKQTKRTSDLADSKYALSHLLDPGLQFVHVIQFLNDGRYPSRSPVEEGASRTFRSVIGYRWN